ncbi:adenylosuccinate synthetase [Candidatus Hydrogenisulfobacillus filiaventi]|uniref:Adenylosuccinate synthetase n=1 Tax=Candidatus Hydrogenisulfobacillus filiaventi TaxID=2707344 RepID=A0A6F8ZKJ5_9FIRM|nr:adenylosuccinate synthase [Bacillota bacterium]CAB1130257.1 adenylosuccinate synthetase [Candidatus Hydrogenisulfobacillus filiaventi]
MPAVVLVGAQWGDEGKGKIVDYISRQADMVVRHQGGSNAGHTVVVGDQEYKLHLIPSGILYPETWCVIANGVVVDPVILLEELDYLQQRGVRTDRLRISAQAHVVMPYHKQLDRLQEGARGAAKLGTTGRGIGPAYMDKAARTGLRVADLLNPADFAARLREALEEKNRLFRAYEAPGWDFDQLYQEFLDYGQRLKPYVTNTSVVINRALDENKRVLFEGAQGTMLDIDHGTYPYVTSSHPVAGGACIGAGVGPTRISQVYGVVKAYTTRVGDGPFPSELEDAIGEHIRQVGAEYGTTTNRPRRIGWLDTVVLRHAVRVNGMTGLIVTRLDVLDDLERIGIVTAYRYRGQLVTDFPESLGVLEECEPVVEMVPGWRTGIGGARRYEDLPPEAREYLERIEALTGVPVRVVSVGRDRAHTIERVPLF